MARRPSQSQTRLFRALIDKLEPGLRAAFEQAVLELRSGIDWRALVDALARQDVDGAIRALKIDRAVFNAYAMAKANAFVEGGQLAAQTVNMPSGPSGPFGGSVSVRFDMSNPVAESWIAENVGGAVTRLTSEQLQSARAAILSGYGQGKHPEAIAGDLAGRVVAGRRQGGIIGLSGPQSELIGSMRSRLESGDATELKKILDGMSLRDRRFDHLIRASIESGKSVARADIDRMVERYSDRMLAKRANDIARTETGTAVMSGRAEEWRQACANLGYPVEAVIKTWRHGGGVKDPRWWHQAMNNKTVQGLNASFTLPNGATMQHALDPQGGAAECVNCSCDTTFRLNHAWNLR